MWLRKYVASPSDFTRTRSLSSPKAVDLNQAAPSASYTYPRSRRRSSTRGGLPPSRRARSLNQLSNSTPQAPPPPPRARVAPARGPGGLAGANPERDRGAGPRLAPAVGLAGLEDFSEGRR